MKTLALILLALSITSCSKDDDTIVTPTCNCNKVAEQQIRTYNPATGDVTATQWQTISSVPYGTDCTKNNYPLGGSIQTVGNQTKEIRYIVRCN